MDQLNDVLVALMNVNPCSQFFFHLASHISSSILSQKLYFVETLCCGGIECGLYFTGRTYEYTNSEGTS